MGQSIKIVDLNDIQNEVLLRVIKAMREVGIKDPSADKVISSFVEDSIHLVEIKLSLENEFSSSVSTQPLIIDEKDMQDILKMTLSELAVYLEKVILIKNLPVQ